MKKKWLFANWKMNGSLLANQALLESLMAAAPLDARASMVICPSFVYLPQVAQLTKNTAMGLGAQNVSEHGQGAYTGECSASMLKDVGVQFAIIGHSERRAYQNEENALLAAKVDAAVKNGLTAVLCVGETLEERDSGKMQAVLIAQIDAVLAGKTYSADQLVIAYEPRWAIGTGVSATSEMIQAAHVFLREHIATHDTSLAERISILYGGSVKASNAAGIFALADVDGGLIGGASLDAAEFSAIYKALLNPAG